MMQFLVLPLREAPAGYFKRTGGTVYYFHRSKHLSGAGISALLTRGGGCFALPDTLNKMFAALNLLLVDGLYLYLSFWFG